MSDEKRYDRVELRMDERGIGRAAINGHDLRCTLEMVVEKASAAAEEITIRMEAIVDGKVFADLARELKPKIQAAKDKAAAKAAKEDTQGVPAEEPTEETEV